MKKSLLTIAISAAIAVPASASTAISGGIWLNHQTLTEKDAKRDDDTQGTVNSEALILYIDHKQENTDWQLSAEWRTGPGSFSNKDSNSTGDFSGFHKLWVGYNFSETRQLLIGKSAVPFGKATINFWPGDMALGGYADQMDVGVKFSDKIDALSYDAAWYISDDFGAASTDTMDDNDHWGSSETYRKVNTGVLNLGYDVAKGSTVGISLQKGELQDLTRDGNGDFNKDDDTTFGGHDAWNVWYEGQYGDLSTIAQVSGSTRTDLDKVGAASADEVKTMRHGVTVAYAQGPLSYYVEYTGASTDTDGNDAADMSSWAPGVSYNYGPGWFYAEYLTQKNYIDTNADVAESDKFSALYLTVDYYF